MTTVPSGPIVPVGFGNGFGFGLVLVLVFVLVLVVLLVPVFVLLPGGLPPLVELLFVLVCVWLGGPPPGVPPLLFVLLLLLLLLFPPLFPPLLPLPPVPPLVDAPPTGVWPAVHAAEGGTVPLVPLFAVVTDAVVWLNTVPVVEAVSVRLPMSKGFAVLASDPMWILPVRVLPPEGVVVVPLTVIFAVALNLLSSATE